MYTEWDLKRTVPFLPHDCYPEMVCKSILDVGSDTVSNLAVPLHTARCQFMVFSRVGHTHLELPAPTLGTRNFSSSHSTYIVHTVFQCYVSISGRFISNRCLFSTMVPHITGLPHAVDCGRSGQSGVPFPLSPRGCCPNSQRKTQHSMHIANSPCS